MMDRLHQAAKSWVFKGVVFVIIASLLLAGIGDYFMRGRSDHVAVVNGTKINRAQFEALYRVEQQRLQARWGDAYASLVTDPTHVSQLKKQVLTQQIGQQLLADYIDQLGLRVDDEAVKTAIRNIPQFQKEGHFDNATYLAALSQADLTPERCSVQVRQGLLQHQLMSALLGSEFVLSRERDGLLAPLIQQREVRQITLPIEPLIAQQVVDASELTHYYHQHPNDFMSPEQLKISYLTFSAATLKDSVQVDEQDILAYYQQHPERYTQLARKNISLIRVATEQQATTLLAQLKQPGSDFSHLARTHSSDRLTAKKGGVLGWIVAGNSLPAFEQAAFALKNPGELSGVVKAEDGYYLLRLNKQQPQRVKPLKQVHAEIEQLLHQRRVIEQFNTLKQRVNSLLSDYPDSLSEIASAIGIKVEQTSLFSRNAMPPAIDFAPLVSALFDEERLRSGQNSEIIDVGGEQAFVVRVEHYQAAARKSFEQVEEAITFLVKQEKAKQQIFQQAEQLLLALRSGQGVQALRNAGLAWGEKQLLTRHSPEYTLTEAVFSHPRPAPERPGYGTAENAQGDIVLFELLQIVAGGDFKVQPKAQSAFSEELLEHKHTVLKEILLKDLYQRANIKQVDLGDIE